MAKKTKTEQIFAPNGVLIVRAGETPEKVGRRRQSEKLRQERARVA